MLWRVVVIYLDEVFGDDEASADCEATIRH